VKLAFLGTGLAASIHSKTMKAVAPDVERWYASRDVARAESARKRFGGAGALAGYEAAIDRPDIDVVLIALPPSLHLEWTLRALARGKHVILEKPPLLRAADFRPVADAARQANRQVLVAENYYYKPLTALLRKIITRGDLGTLKFIHLNALKRQTTSDWRDDPNLNGPGALFEGGIHWVSFLASLGLKVRRIKASRAGTGAVDRSVGVMFEYEEGAVATLAYSWDVPGAINGVRWSACYGTEGVLRFESNGLLAVQSGKRRRVHLTGVIDLLGYRAMLRDFFQAIHQNKPPAYTLALAERDLSLVEQAYASLQTY
jgi:predicted dehydrogenase